MFYELLVNISQYMFTPFPIEQSGWKSQVLKHLMTSSVQLKPTDRVICHLLVLSLVYVCLNDN